MSFFKDSNENSDWWHEQDYKKRTKFNMTDICDYHSGNAKEYIEYLMTTDEYMEFAKQKEIEYSKE